MCFKNIKKNKFCPMNCKSIMLPRICALPFCIAHNYCNTLMYLMYPVHPQHPHEIVTCVALSVFLSINQIFFVQFLVVLKAAATPLAEFHAEFVEYLRLCFMRRCNYAYRPKPAAPLAHVITETRITTYCH